MIFRSWLCFRNSHPLPPVRASWVHSCVTLHGFRVTSVFHPDVSLMRQALCREETGLIWLILRETWGLACYINLMGVLQQQRHDNKRQEEVNSGQVHSGTAQRTEKLFWWTLVSWLPRTLLLVQWLRVRLPMQDLWVWSVVRELRSHLPLDQKTKT